MKKDIKKIVPDLQPLGWHPPEETDDYQVEKNNAAKAEDIAESLRSVMEKVVNFATKPLHERIQKLEGNQFKELHFQVDQLLAPLVRRVEKLENETLPQRVFKLESMFADMALKEVRKKLESE